MKKSTLLFTAFLYLCSCTRESPEVDSPANERGRTSESVRCRIRSVGILQDDSNLPMRSAEIRQVQIAAYSDGRLEVFAEADNQSSDCPEPVLRLDIGKEYHLYVAVNFASEEISSGKAGHGPFPENESELESVELKIQPPDNYFKDGLPMCNLEPAVFVPNGLDEPEIKVSRLFARYRLNFFYGGQAAGESFSRFVPDSIKLMNLPSSLNPFSAVNRADDVWSGSYPASAFLDEDGTLALYLPENMQGEASGISSPSEKLPPNLSAGGLNPSLCTGVEVSGVYNLYSAPAPDSAYFLSQPVRYACFLGGNAPGNCDIVRNEARNCNFIYYDYGWSCDTFISGPDGEADADCHYRIGFCDGRGRHIDRQTLPVGSTRLDLCFFIQPGNAGKRVECLSSVPLAELGLNVRDGIAAPEEVDAPAGIYVFRYYGDGIRRCGDRHTVFLLRYTDNENPFVKLYSTLDCIVKGEPEIEDWDENDKYEIIF